MNVYNCGRCVEMVIGSLHQWHLQACGTAASIFSNTVTIQLQRIRIQLCFVAQFYWVTEIDLQSLKPLICDSGKRFDVKILRERYWVNLIFLRITQTLYKRCRRWTFRKPNFDRPSYFKWERRSHSVTNVTASTVRTLGILTYFTITTRYQTAS